jgi:methyl-accepting chemotaxis protein
MNRHSIRQRLTLLLVVPLASLLFFGGSIVSERYRQSREMDDVGRLVQITVRAAELLHHTQRERGLSAGFMGAQGDSATVFRQQLVAERQQTDAAVAAMRTAVAALGPAFLGAASIAAFGEVNRRIERLGAIRSGAVDNRESRPADVVASYTLLNQLILAFVAEMSRQTSTVAINNRSAALLSLMNAKEILGIERAVLTNTFSAEAFGPGMYRRVVGLTALEDSHLASFRVHGGSSVWQKLEETMQGPFVAKTREMRERALASGGGAVRGVDPKVWFGEQTAKMEAMRRVEAWLAADIIEAAAGLATRSHRALAFALALMIAIVAGTFVLGALVVRSIVGPLGRAVEVLGAVASGDFTTRLAAQGRDEVARMAASLNQALLALQQTLGDVRQSATSVSSAAQQTAATSDRIARGAQKQAANLQETATALKEITVVGRRNTENAANATQLAAGARDVAEQGQTVVTDAVAAMDAIAGASKRITQIVGVIDEIAFNTNLLALNAAIEAGRAGEHGRGFAVVASEVGELANRCSVAASEIRGLVEDAARKVEAGTKLVNRSGQMLGDIVGSAKGVTDIVTEIASATREQALGVEQINKAVLAIDEVTEGSVRQTEELSATAEEVAAQAKRLLTLVAQFRLAAQQDDAPALLAATLRPGAAPPRPSDHVKPS